MVKSARRSSVVPQCPVILQGSRRLAQGEPFLRHLIAAAVEAYPELPIVMHQDPGASPDVCMDPLRLHFGDDRRLAEGRCQDTTLTSSSASRPATCWPSSALRRSTRVCPKRYPSSGFPAAGYLPRRIQPFHFSKSFMIAGPCRINPAPDGLGIALDGAFCWLSLKRWIVPHVTFSRSN